MYTHYKLIIDNDKEILTLNLLLQVSRYQNSSSSGSDVQVLKLKINN